MKIASKTLFYLTILALIGGCKNADSQLNDLLNIGEAINSLNSRISLAAPQALNTFKLGDDVSIAVEVISDDQIAFAYNYGVRIFLQDGNKWKEIDNYMEYPQGTIVIESRKTNPLNIGEVVIYPYLPDYEKDVKLRIFVIGNIYINGEITQEKTAAHLDVDLKP